MWRDEPLPPINGRAPSVLACCVLEDVDGDIAHAVDWVCCVQTTGGIDIVVEGFVTVNGISIAAHACAFRHGADEEVRESRAIVGS